MKILRLLAVGIAALAMPCVGLASATVESVSGEVLSNGLPVFKGQVLLTEANVTTAEASTVLLRFDDGMNVALNENSRLRIVDFRYTRGPNDRVVMDLLQGGARVSTGQVARANPKQFFFRTPQYAQGQQLLVADVNAVIEGLYQGGATEVHVVDGHGSGNPDPDVRRDLLDKRATQILRDSTFDAYVDLAQPNAYDAVAVVGMHAKTGSGGFASHTYTLGIEFLIHGKTITETELVGLSWGRVGTPVIWYVGIPALIAMIAWFTATRDWRAGTVLLAYGAGIGPWAYFALADDRTMYIFYALPSLPFMIIALALTAGLAIGRVSLTTRRLFGASAVGAFALLAVINFWWLYPVLAAESIPYQDWYNRMLYTSWYEVEAKR